MVRAAIGVPAAAAIAMSVKITASPPAQQNALAINETLVLGHLADAQK